MCLLRWVCVVVCVCEYVFCEVCARACVYNVVSIFQSLCIFMSKMCVNECG